MLMFRGLVHERCRVKESRDQKKENGNEFTVAEIRGLLTLVKIEGILRGTKGAA